MSVYVVMYLHEYGSNAYLVSSEATPTVKQLVRELDLNFEPSKSESLQIEVLSDEEYQNPKHLGRLEGDEDEFDEYAEAESEDLR